MLLKSTSARVAFAIAFGVLVALSALLTGGSLAWVISLGALAALVSYGAQTLYARLRAGKQGK